MIDTMHLHPCERAYSAWTALAPRAPLQRRDHEFAELGAREVEIEVSHCGICRSDLHLIDDDWGLGRYPLVPGHEIVGLVRARGPAVADLQVGQRVGVGWLAGACGHCHACNHAHENLCGERQRTCVERTGGFAERVRVDARFVFALPEQLDSAHAAPLMCAGATVFAPIERYAVGSDTRVGVIGLGGLGHLAVMFARARGAEVAVFSGSPSKSTLALELGAARVIASDDRDAIKAERGHHDLILSTVDHELDWSAYVRALRPGGTLCLLGAPASKLAIPAALLIDGQRSVSGSVFASPTVIRNMLASAARAGIAPMIQTMAMDEVERGLACVRDGSARLRVVLVR
jgi:uncharacterized zinc-type alcohol dehydrogenase-like protein